MLNHHPRGSRRALATLTGALACAATAATSHAQEAMYTAAATMPSPGVAVARQQLHLWRHGADPVSGARSFDRIELHNSLQLGLARDWALGLELPVETRLAKRAADGGTNTTTSVPEVDLTFKWRLLQSDPSGIDTQRLALLGGARARTDEQLGVDPHLGAVYTVVSGRHGFNAEVHYTWNTISRPQEFNIGGDGNADAAAVNLAYVFRIFPDRFTSESTGAWYVTLEINSLYETNNDWEMRLSPGLMYEGRRWGFEIMAQLPLANRVRNRAELDWAIGIGWRLIF